jgi:hypothetical protein
MTTKAYLAPRSKRIRPVKRLFGAVHRMLSTTVTSIEQAAGGGPLNGEQVELLGKIVRTLKSIDLPAKEVHKDDAPTPEDIAKALG